MQKSDKVRELQNLWRVDRDLRKCIPIREVHRRCLGMAMKIEGDDKEFPRRLTVLTVIDIPVGHMRSRNRQSILARGYTLNLGGAGWEDVETLCLGGVPIRGLNVDLGFFPFSPEDSWLHSDFLGKWTAPRAGKVEIKEEGGFLVYLLDDKPLVKLAMSNRRDIRSLTNTGDIVESGQPLFLVTHRLRGETFVETDKKMRDILNAGDYTDEFEALMRVSCSMTQRAIIEQEHWRISHEKFKGTINFLRQKEGYCGALGLEAVDEVENLINLCENEWLDLDQLPKPLDWAPSVLATFEDEDVSAFEAEIMAEHGEKFVFQPSPAEGTGKWYVDNALKVQKMRKGGASVKEISEYFEKSQTTIRRALSAEVQQETVPLWAMPWSDVPEDISGTVSGYVFDSRKLQKLPCFNGWHICPPMAMERWDAFTQHVGDDIIADLYPGDSRFSLTEIPQKQLQNQASKSKEARKKFAK